MSPTKPIPEKGAAAATDEAKVLDLFRTFVKERAYLIFKGDAISVIDTEAYAKSLKAAQDRERESRRESRASPAGRKSPNDTPSPGTQRRLKTTGGSGREIVTMSAQEEAEMEAKRAKRQRQAKTDRESGLRLTYMDPALPGGKRATPAAVFSEAQRLKEEEIYREAKTKALRKEAEREAKRKELVPELPPVTPTKTYSNLHDRSYLQELREKRMVGKEVSPSKHDKGFDPTNPLRKVNRKTGGINASPPRHKVRTSPNSRVRAVISPASAKAGPSQKASKEFNKPAPTVPTALLHRLSPRRMCLRGCAVGTQRVALYSAGTAKDRVNDMFAKSPDPRLNQVFGSTYTGIEARPRPLVDGDRFSRHHRRDNHGTFRQPFVSRDNVQPTRDTLQDVVQPEALRRSAEKKPYVPRRLPLDGSRVKKLLNMTPAGGLTRDEAQAAALKAKERELKSPGKKPRKPTSIKELKAKIKLTDAKAVPVNDPRVGSAEGHQREDATEDGDGGCRGGEGDSGSARGGGGPGGPGSGARRRGHRRGQGDRDRGGRCRPYRAR